MDVEVYRSPELDRSYTMSAGAVLAGGIVIGGFAMLVSVTAGLAVLAIAALVWTATFRMLKHPQVVADDCGITVRNALRTVEVAWSAVGSFEVRSFGRTLQIRTSDGRVITCSAIQSGAAAVRSGNDYVQPAADRLQERWLAARSCRGPARDA
jgi:hypothetical protein